MKKIILKNEKIKIIYEYYKKTHKTKLSFEEFLFIGENYNFVCQALSFYSQLDLKKMNEKEIEENLSYEIGCPQFHKEIENFISNNDIGRLNEISFDFDSANLIAVLKDIKDFQPLTAEVINIQVIEKILNKKPFYAPSIKFNTINECIDGFIDCIFEEYTGDFSPSPTCQRKEYLEKIKEIKQKVEKNNE